MESRPEQASDLLDRRGAIVIPRQTLHHLLSLPDSYQIITIYTTQDPATIQVLVVSPDLEPVDPGMFAPPVGDGQWKRKHILDSEGRQYVRWEWMDSNDS